MAAILALLFAVSVVAAYVILVVMTIAYLLKYYDD